MRLLCVLPDQEKGAFFSQFLTNEGIENQLEFSTNSDWGSSEYGDVSCKIWIYQEEQFDTASDHLARFLENPKDPFFKSHHKKQTVIDVTPMGDVGQPQEEFVPYTKWDRQPIGKITYTLFLICCLLLFASIFTTPEIPADLQKTSLPTPPIFSSPIDKALLYDYPAAYEVVDKLIHVYGVEQLQNPEALPAEGKYLFKKFNQTPYWQGIYDQLAPHLRHWDAPWDFSAPMFEKIRQGEVWRLFTPCLLHNDIFHLFFNMIWLLVLGKQMEQRITRGRYLLFIAITAIFTNTVQYLISGPNFLGYSGVLCAMVGFIWARKKYAAWEGYQLQYSTINFLTIFVLFMFAIQFASFFYEVYGGSTLSVGIANSAHLAGGISGILLGRLNFFSWKH